MTSLLKYGKLRRFALPAAILALVSVACADGTAKKPDASDDNEIVLSHWTLAFRHRDLPGYVTEKDKNTSSSYGEIATVLSNIFPNEVGVQQYGDALIIKGPKEKVRRIKTILAKWIDVPYARVRLNAMTFQATSKSYNSRSLVDTVQTAQAGVEIARGFTTAWLEDLHHFMMDTYDLMDFRFKREAASENRIYELFGKFHLLNYGYSSGTPWLNGATDDEKYEKLEEGFRHPKPFVDELAYLTLVDRVKFFATKDGDGLSVFQQYMKTHRAKFFLSQQREAIKERGKLVEGSKISEEEKTRARRVIKSLESLVVTLEDSLKTPLPKFNVRVGSNYSERLNSNEVENVANQVLATLLSFMHEYSMPNTYEELCPISRLDEQLKQANKKVSETERWLNEAQSDFETAKANLVLASAAVVKLRKDINKAEENKTAEKTTGDLDKVEAKMAELKKAQEKNSTAINDAKFPRPRKDLKSLEAERDQIKEKIEALAPAIARLQGQLDLLKKLPKLFADAVAQEAQERLLVQSQEDRLDSLNKKLDRAKIEQRVVMSEKDHTVQVIGTSKPSRPVDPELLAMLSTNLDTLIVRATEAFSSDLQTAIVDPLRFWVESLGRDHKAGLTFAGNIEVAVTSQMGASSGGTSSFNTPNTPITNLSKDNVQALIEITKGTSFFSAEGFGSLLVGLAGITEDDPNRSPTYTNLAPSLDMAVVPTVLPGSQSARLQISLRSGIDLQDVDSSKRGAVPIDYVKSHETRTDVAIDAFDLFPLSTFKIETTVQGDPAWQIPVLEGLPIIGKFFVGPRRPIGVAGHSLVVVYATIVPRSMDIARRYSASSN